jgi:choline-sulfatase
MLEKTVIIFSSDHGDNLGDFGIWDKRFFYRQSCGVPLVMSGPGILKQASRSGSVISKALVSHLDLYPTILHLAGIEHRLDHTFFGRSLLQILDGQRDGFHSAVFAELATSVMICTGSWKMVFDPEQGGVNQLFNLLIDPQELENLAGRPGYEETVRDLLARILAHRIGITQYTHQKEEKRLQRFRIEYR